MNNCNQNCNQGRECTCSGCYDKWAAKTIATIFLMATVIVIGAVFVK